MAVVIQPVVGRRHDDCFYPDFSGVACSYNYYPVGQAKPEDGVANVALGLGKTVVDGGASLRFTPAFPGVLPQFPSVKDLFQVLPARVLRDRHAPRGLGRVPGGGPVPGQGRSGPGGGGRRPAVPGIDLLARRRRPVRRDRSVGAPDRHFRARPEERRLPARAHPERPAAAEQRGHELRGGDRVRGDAGRRRTRSRPSSASCRSGPWWRRTGWSRWNWTTASASRCVVLQRPGFWATGSGRSSATSCT